MSLPTATEIRNFLEGYGITSEVLNDSWIEGERDDTIIPYVEGILGYSISTVEEKVEYLSGTGTDILIMNRKNIVSLTSIEFVRGGDVYSRIDIGSVDVISEKGILKAKVGIPEFYDYTIFPKGNNNIKIKYNVGGALTNEVRKAIIKLCCIVILNNIEGRTGGGDLTVQGFSRSHGKAGRYHNIRSRLHAEAMYVISRKASSVVGS
jgi:hypothetical protein